MVLVILAVKDVIDLIEDTADITDQDDQDEQPIKYIVDDVETGSDDVVLEPVVKYLYLIDFCQVYQL